MSEEVIRQCRTCNRSGPEGFEEDWHPYRHSINGWITGDGDDDLSTPQVKDAGPFPFDPVLRQALVDKGVLTPQDLRDAEEKIRMVSGMGVE